MKQFEERLKRAAQMAKDVYGGDWISVSVDAQIAFGGKVVVKYFLSNGFGDNNLTIFETLEALEEHIESRRSPWPRDLIHRKFKL